MRLTIPLRIMAVKTPISLLPLPLSTHLLTSYLTPDPQIKSPADFLQVLKTKPSIQRRSRSLSPESHFSYVAPLPIHFPYRIEPPDPPPPDDQRAEYIEKWLAELEAQEEQPSLPSPNPGRLKKFTSKNRDQERVLIGLSETGLRDCLPHLDVGDSLSVIGPPSLSSVGNDERETHLTEGVAARKDLIDVLSGHALLVGFDENSEANFAPWALRYSGHQFGMWAGQLGDGRAISVLVTPHPSDPDLTYEVQVKGAGRTPFSRSADGLAVVRSSIREFLAAEAMHALSIPTTRSLCLISLPQVSVYRERVETACIAARLAPSFIRIGSFEALKAPLNIMILGGGQQPADWEALRILGEWVGKRVLRLPDVSWDVGSGSAWGKKLVWEVAVRNAKMVAGWQAYGFMHGVINTDNVSIMGLTIDYGPYAFMDVFDRLHICNHTDEEGRYSYNRQPDMILFALRALLDSLAPIIGAESELGGKAVSVGWAKDASDDTLDTWSMRGKELRPELEQVFNVTYSEEYRRLMRRRLGLRRSYSTDGTSLLTPLLRMMEEFMLDFHFTFRTLSSFSPSILRTEAIDPYISKIISGTPYPDKVNREHAIEEIKAWLEIYAKRIEDEHSEWTSSGGNMDSHRQADMKTVNPRFILRQWVLEEVISKVESDADSGKRVLAKVLQMACNPFEPWGGESQDILEEELEEEIRAERRYCGLGDTKMLGFQCSCSS